MNRYKIQIKVFSLLSLVFVLMINLSLAQNVSKTQDNPKINKGMIKVMLLYPNGDGKTFNMDYYSNKHMPLVKALLGDHIKAISIDKGLANGVPNTPVPYLAIGYLYFDSMTSFQNAMGGAASAKLMADIPNSTNTQPIIQISEVLQ